MLQKNIVIIVFVFFVLGLLAGFFGGYFLGKGQKISVSPPEKTAGNTTANTIILEKSKTIISLTALVSGEVSLISDRVLTITAEGDTLKIPITEQAKINLLLLPKNGGTMTEPKAMEFKDIKVGDKINITSELSDGGWKGIHLIVIRSL